MSSGDYALFNSISFRGHSFRNRIWVPAMCQYVAMDGLPTEWHFAHYAGLASSVGAVIVEATATSKAARVTPFDLCLDSDAQLCEYERLASSISVRGAVPGIQLSHAGRKGSRSRPWEGDVALHAGSGGWEVFAPSPLPFGEGYATPKMMGPDDIEHALEEFSAAAVRASRAGFKLIEVHAGHGRLVHSFLSPISNQRNDEFGGSLENRARFARLLASRIRSTVGEEVVLAFRLSCVDWRPDGLSISDTVQISKWLKACGVDLIDCSSGGIVRPLAKEIAPGYQVKFAKQIRQEANVATAAVGLIQTLPQANDILVQHAADVVLMGRALMLDPLALTRLAAASGRIELVPQPYRKAVTREARASAIDHIPEL